jgi:acyl-CoA dehydrogenase
VNKSPFYTADHNAYRDVVRRFVEKEIEPHAHEWDEAGSFPRVLYEKAAEIGLLGLGFPEEYGGTEVDNFMWIVAVQELARAGAGGVSASLKSNSIGAPPIARAGTPGSTARRPSSLPACAPTTSPPRYAPAGRDAAASASW